MSASNGGSADQHNPNQPNHNRDEEDRAPISNNGAVGNDDAAGGAANDAAAAGPGGSAEAAMEVDDNDPLRAATSERQLTDIPVGDSPLDSTINILQAHINREFRKIDAGTSTLSDQTLKLIYKLFGAVDRKMAARSAASGSGGSGSGGHSASGGCSRSDSGGRTAGGGGGRSNNDSRGGGNSNGYRGNRSGRSPRSDSSRPRCTYNGCRHPIGHTYDKCFQRLRVEGDKDAGRGNPNGSGRGSSGGGGSNSGRGDKRPKNSSNPGNN